MERTSGEQEIDDDECTTRATYRERTDNSLVCGE